MVPQADFAKVTIWVSNLEKSVRVKEEKSFIWAGHTWRSFPPEENVAHNTEFGGVRTPIEKDTKKTTQSKHVGFHVCGDSVCLVARDAGIELTTGLHVKLGCI